MHKQKYELIKSELENLASNNKIEHEKCLVDLNQSKEDYVKLNAKLLEASKNHDSMGEESRECLKSSLII